MRIRVSRTDMEGETSGTCLFPAARSGRGASERPEGRRAGWHPSEGIVDHSFNGKYSASGRISYLRVHVSAVCVHDLRVVHLKSSTACHGGRRCQVGARCHGDSIEDLGYDDRAHV